MNPENILAKVLELGEPVDLSQFDETDPVVVEAAEHDVSIFENNSGKRFAAS